MKPSLISWTDNHFRRVSLINESQVKAWMILPRNFTLYLTFPLHCRKFPLPIVESSFLWDVTFRIMGNPSLYEVFLSSARPPYDKSPSLWNVLTMLGALMILAAFAGCGSCFLTSIVPVSSASAAVFPSSSSSGSSSSSCSSASDEALSSLESASAGNGGDENAAWCVVVDNRSRKWKLLKFTDHSS